MKKYKFEAEQLAYWYLRLNGFLMIENFILHDEAGGPQRTDIDLIALRFPHRREGLRGYDECVKWMEDDLRFLKKPNPFVAFVEVTIGQCKLNGPWTNSKKRNLPRALRAFGAVPEHEIDQVSESLYTTGRHQSNSIELGLVSVGERKNPKLDQHIPGLLQIEWREILGFIFERFSKHERIKRERPQWSLDGHQLWQMFLENRDNKDNFQSSFQLVTERSPSRNNTEEFCRSRIYL